jgi:hypothetical protein
VVHVLFNVVGVMLWFVLIADFRSPELDDSFAL